MSADLLQKPADYTFKYIVIGDAGVGKSCLLKYFIDKTFIPDGTHTIGVELGTRVADIGGVKVKLEIWDTAGQERFKSVTKVYFRASAGTLLCYDITRRQTFNHLATWLTDARNLTPETCQIILVGNKLDLASQREVSYEEAANFAKEQNLVYMETSAKTGQNVEDAFLVTAKKILEKVQNGVIDVNDPNSGVIKHADRPVIDPRPNLKDGGHSGGSSNNCPC